MAQAPSTGRHMVGTQHWDAIWPTVGEKHLRNAHTPSRFEVARSNGVWTVSKDSTPIERHNCLADAVLSVRDAMQAIFANGAAADWRLLRGA